MVKIEIPQIADTPFFDPLTGQRDTLVCCLRRARSASRSKPSPRAVPGRGRSAEAVDESETGSANFFGPAPVARVFSWTPFHVARFARAPVKKKTAQIACRTPSDPLTI